MKNYKTLLTLVCLGTAVVLSLILPKKFNARTFVNSNNSINLNSSNELKVKDVKKEITLSFVGDCTLNKNTDSGYSNSFVDVFNKNNKDYSYFFKGVKSVLDKDDLSIANLETTFTNHDVKEVKEFNFRGDPSYAKILLNGSIEIVNLANNHTYDYSDKGYKDTIDVLNGNNIGYYGKNRLYVKEVKGVKIGFAGFTGFGDTISTSFQIKEALNYLKNNDIKIKIVSFHWGIENNYSYNIKQEELGKWAIDNGADLVIGHHPHVLQGIERYHDKYIVYSLGNFVFGGNKNPYDKDSMIFQQIFNFNNNELVDNKINIIPVSISSKSDINDYQPVILENDQKIKVLEKINKYSKNFKYDINK